MDHKIQQHRGFIPLTEEECSTIYGMGSGTKEDPYSLEELYNLVVSKRTLVYYYNEDGELCSTTMMPDTDIWPEEQPTDSPEYDDEWYENSDSSYYENSCLYDNSEWYENSELHEDNDTTIINSGTSSSNNGTSNGSGTGSSNNGTSNGSGTENCQNGEQQAETSDTQLLVDTAMKYLGYSEDCNLDTILGWLKTAGVVNPTQNTGWCASFVYCMFIEAGLNVHALAKASVRGWREHWGTEVYTPQVGDIAIWNLPGESHMGIVVEVIGDTIVIISGNYGNAVKIERGRKASTLLFKRKT